MIRVIHPLVTSLRPRFVLIEAIGVLHDKFPAAHETEARSDLVPKFCLDLIAIQGQLPIGPNLSPHQVGDDLFMRGAQAKIAFMTIFKAEQLFAVKIPPARLSPEFRRRSDRHQHFLRAGSIHFFPHDSFDLTDDAEPQR